MHSVLGFVVAALWTAQIPGKEDPGLGPLREGTAIGDLTSRYQVYGEPEDTTVGELARDPRHLHQRAVRVVGRIELLSDGRWYVLRDGAEQVLLLPVENLDETYLRELMGLPVEITGVARELRDYQGTCFPTKPIPQSKCDDPLLPALPDRQNRPQWPRSSITYWSVGDATPVKPLELWEPNRDSTLVRLTRTPEEFGDQSVTVLGQFCGDNLYGDLPAESRRKPSDWVIREGDAAIWITGKDPKGKGWRLDPRSEAESRWWIEVTGKVEIENGVPYLKATRLALKPAPASSER